MLYLVYAVRHCALSLLHKDASPESGYRDTVHYASCRGGFLDCFVDSMPWPLSSSAKMRHHGQTLAYSPTWRTS
jgi:hypothetical protein